MEQKQLIEELQERIAILRKIKDTQKIIDVSYMTLQNESIPQESNPQNIILEDALLTNRTSSDESTWKEVEKEENGLKRERKMLKLL